MSSEDDAFVDSAFAKTRSASVCLEASLRRCPFLAMLMQQRRAKNSNSRYKAKARSERFSLGEVRDPASVRNEPQRAANAVFSGW